MKAFFGMTAAALLVVMMLFVSLPGTAVCAEQVENKKHALNELRLYIEQDSPQIASTSTPDDIPRKPWWAVWFLGDIYEAFKKAELTDKARARLFDLESTNSNPEDIEAARKAVEILMKSTLSELIDIIKNTPGTSITGPPPKVDKLAVKYIEELLKEWIKKELKN